MWDKLWIATLGTSERVHESQATDVMLRPSMLRHMRARPLPEIGGHGSMFPYTYIRILTAANVLRALRASRERSACSQQTSEKLSSNWKHSSRDSWLTSGVDGKAPL